MSTEIQHTQQGDIVRSEVPADVIEKLVLHGDLSGMQPQDKVTYYNGICKSLGLNPLTQPFAITKLNGKEVMYAKKDCTEQLRKIYGVSVIELIKEQVGDIYMVTAKVSDRTGRTDSSVGAVALTGKSGEALANWIMKAETKAKRRATLSICGLGMLDEVEVDDVRAANTQQAKEEMDSMNIDVVDPTNEQMFNHYDQMLQAIFSPKVPVELFGGQSKEDFVADFRHNLTSGTLSVSFADNVYQKVLECHQKP